MNKEFIPYEQALELKELGFDEECGAFYFKDLENIYQKYCEWFVSNDDAYYYGEEILCVAPLHQQAFRWFRERHNILSIIYANASGFLYEWEDAIGGTHRGWSDCEGPNNGGVWDTYEEAELACLKKLIEIVKTK